jgi:hypothetical protein
MRPFLLACLTVAVIAAAAAVILDRTAQKSPAVAYAPSSVRL